CGRTQQFSQCLLATAMVIVWAHHDWGRGAAGGLYDPHPLSHADGERLFDHHRQTSLQCHDGMSGMERRRTADDRRICLVVLESFLQIVVTNLPQVGKM